VLEGITIGPSPAWLRQRLEGAGTRSINNVVDITNYVLLEWGQPLHAFDLDRLQGVAGEPLTIGVRYAAAGETLRTLDQQDRTLAEPTLLISANDVPVALAGVMGGETTEVYTGTQRVFLEAAYFDSATIRRSARSQGLRTEASARFERGVNPAELELACNRAIALLQAIAGAKVVGQWHDRTESGKITPTRTVSLRLQRVHEILGKVEDAQSGAVALPPETIVTILTKLGCQVSDLSPEGIWHVEVPPYRYRDLEREIDLIEEVARLYGYNRFARTLPNQGERGFLPPEIVIARQVRAALRAVGLTEALHYSLTKPEPHRVVLANPLFSEYSALRSDLITGLIEAFQFNLEQGNGSLYAFEMGHVFSSTEAGGIQESEKVAGILGGDNRSGLWVNSGRTQSMGWYEAKGCLESAFARLGLAVDYRPLATPDARWHPGRTASLWVRGNMDLGLFGQLHPQVCQDKGLPQEVYGFELNWSPLVQCLHREPGKALQFQSYSTYPPSDRDLAFFVANHITVAELQKLMTRSAGNLLESITLFDEYRGDGVPEGERSLAFRLVYRALDRTLTDQDIDPAHQKVRAALEKTYKVSLRS
jgi:phenylalanyl-tRNA synthetase beta chain